VLFVAGAWSPTVYEYFTVSTGSLLDSLDWNRATSVVMGAVMANAYVPSALTTLVRLNVTVLAALVVAAVSTTAPSAGLLFQVSAPSVHEGSATPARDIVVAC